MGWVLGWLSLQRRPKVYDTSKLVTASTLLRTSPLATLARLNSSDALPDSVGRNLGLSYAECDVGFPKLWPELLATKKLFTARKTGKNFGITQADLDKADENDGTRVSSSFFDRLRRPPRRVKLTPVDHNAILGACLQVAVINGQVYGTSS